MSDSPRKSPTLTTTTTVHRHIYTKTTTTIACFNTRKTMSFAYCFPFFFIACAIFFFLNPSGSSSPWLNNIWKLSSISSFSHQPNTSLQLSNNKDNNQSLSNDQMGISQSSKSQPFSGGTVSLSQESRNSSLNSTLQFSGKVEGSKESNKTTPLLNGSSNMNVSNHQSFLNDSREDNLVKNQFSLKSENVTRNESREGFMVKERKKDWVEMMSKCNIYDGGWVRDDSYPLYPGGSCPHIDEPFNCFVNGRLENGYEKYKWQPMDCNIPRLNGKDMLELLRGKRLVFVGDSLNRNMWESLVCVLRNSVEDKSRVFEASGRREFRTEGSYSFIFKDYNCSVEFFRSPFLVQEWEIPDTNGSKKETLRLDVIERSSDKYKSADVLIFNTGHWWTHEKTLRGKGYYQEGSHIYGELNVKEAFRKALTTWARWVDANIDPMKTLVFFRGYSASHFSGGQWNSGGQCDNETEPIKNVTYLENYPRNMRTLESVMKGMKTPVFYLNLTRLTDFRKDAHPSIYRKQNLTEEERKSPLRFQDCSHWCLPGVPDTWNELVYAQLLIKHNQKQKQQLQQQQQQQWQKRP